jgi:hypothetical protein
MKENKVYFSRFLSPAIALIGFFISSGCVMEGDEGDFSLFPGGLPITRVSVDGGGVQGDGQSYNPSVNADGRYVVFYSSAANLVLGDTNMVRDVFVAPVGK